MSPSPAIIQLVENTNEKKALALKILRALPDWFGIEQALMQYVEDVQTQTMLQAIVNDQAVGFIALKKHFPQAWEVAVMGIEPSFHRHGLGRMLINHAFELACQEGVLFMTVKTVKQPEGGPDYAKTLAFYESMGFAPLEVFPTLWDPWNPCLLLVKGLHPSGLNPFMGG